MDAEAALEGVFDVRAEVVIRSRRRTGWIGDAVYRG